MENNVENTTNTGNEANTMLGTALTTKEKEWYKIFEDYCKKTDRRYVITWHLSQDLGIKTAKVNYHLNKLVDRGVLKKETNCYCTKFYYAADFS